MSDILKSYIAVVIALIFASRQMVWLEFSDGDYYWHLATGRYIFNAGLVPVFDIFSFTLSDCEWINVNWFAQIILFLIHKNFGDFGIYLLIVAIIAIISALYVYMMVLRGVGALVFSLTWVILLYSIFSISLFRPQVFSLLLFALLSFWLFDQRNDQPLSKFKLAVLISAIGIWNYLHAGVIFAYAILSLDIVGSELNRFLSGERRISRRSSQILTAMICGICFFVFHPSGFNAFYYIFSYRNNLKPEFYQYIQELLPLLAYPVLALICIGAVTTGAFLLFREKARINYRVLLPLLFLLLSAAQYARIAPFLMLFYLPYFALCLSRKIDRGNIHKQVMLYPWVLLFSLAVFIFMVFVQKDSLKNGFARHDLMPVGATEFVNSRNISGRRFFSEYSATGYLLWANENKNDVFIDGRGDLYSCNDTFSDYLKIISLSPGYEEMLNIKYNVDYVLFPRESGMITALKNTKEWIVTYEDRYFTLLKKGPD